MREIRFRAWFPTNKRMIYESDFKGDGIYDEKAEFWKRRYLNPSYKVMQYTGLKDKNGVEIYEGDIVNAWRRHFDGTLSQYNPFAVVWGNNEDSDIGNDTTGFNIGNDLVVEVIGNIYEAPDLLEATKVPDEPLASQQASPNQLSSEERK